MSVVSIRDVEGKAPCMQHAWVSVWRRHTARGGANFVYHLAQPSLSRPVQDPECQSSADLREIQALATSNKALKLSWE